jgi:hypothetical protein
LPRGFGQQQQRLQVCDDPDLMAAHLVFAPASVLAFSGSQALLRLDFGALGMGTTMPFRQFFLVVFEVCLDPVELALEVSLLALADLGKIRLNLLLEGLLEQTVPASRPPRGERSEGSQRTPPGQPGAGRYRSRARNALRFREEHHPGSRGGRLGLRPPTAADHAKSGLKSPQGIRDLPGKSRSRRGLVSEACQLHKDS